jgi:structure-specific endonuclease subunit SLX1
MKTVVSPMEDLPCYDEGIPSEEDKEPTEDEEPDETSDHGLQPLDLETGTAGSESDTDEFAPMEQSGVCGPRISESSAPQPVEEETRRVADSDPEYCIDDPGYMEWSRNPIGDIGYMEWSRIGKTSDLPESRASPRCSLSSCSEDVARRSVDYMSTLASPVSKAGPDDFFHETDVVDLITPVGRFARDCSKTASICPKIIDLTNSPIVIEL